MKKQFTVDTLRRLLNQISAAGYGDAEIFIGKYYPLMDDSVISDLYNNKVRIRNTYYDKKMAEAMNEASEGMKAVYRTYLSDCYKATMILIVEELILIHMGYSIVNWEW